MATFGRAFGNSLAQQGTLLKYFLKDSEGFFLKDSEGNSLIVNN